MPGRILTLQRQARELGRLRTGLTDESGSRPRPVRSDTWIVTSHAEHYIEAAAAEWGGTPEKWQPQGSGAAQFRVITQTNCLDAILPPGDPLSQTYEMWSRGGCQRRCDGITEQLTDSPCLCIAAHGDQWYEQEKGKVCSAHTRLNVILPQMPDIGVWRMETGSFYAANEIAAHVDLIRSSTNSEIAVPIRLRMEQRQRVANGQTKKFPVIAVELRGSTAGQLMSGTANLNAIESSVEPVNGGAAAAIGAAPAVNVNDYLEQIQGATTREELLAIRENAKTAGVTGEQATALDDAMRHRAHVLAEISSGESVEDTEENRAALYQQIVGASGFDSTEELRQDFLAVTGSLLSDASVVDLRAYLDAS